MLVQTRGVNDTLILNAGTPYEAIVIVLKVKGKQVRLGVQADPRVSIDRGKHTDDKPPSSKEAIA